MRNNLIFATTTAIGLVAASASFAQDGAGWVPEEPVTFVVPFGAGGGSDVLARTIATVINDLDIVPTSINIENHPGGSGAIGYNHLAQQSGNPHVLGTVSVSFFTTPLMGGSPVNYEDFTPVAGIAMSPYILVVPEDSPIKSIDDIKSADRLTTGTVGVVSDAALLSRMISDKADVTVDAVPFDGEGEVLSSLLGKHVDFMFANPGEVTPQIEAGTLRAVAVSTAERLPSLPDVPTLQESGLDIEHVQLRGVVMPPEVPEEAVAYWEDVFKQVAESDAWKEQYLDRFGDEPRFASSEEFAEILKETNDLYAGMMEQTGNAQ
ncbi:tripartite tricarboxylate transporter substrate binding protein [Aurantimonas aggregata]|uniref:Tripartite tricarboxylate transporter substrate binding protein n=1 Tax=Aurantimonas aggregata TaxID=2047720 RepID=A0A6L9MFE8_9HYPH|nr:tripartite tricarboxylate transporter substrate binding protein [Aurantimonas aggregata]NDV86574.1 tripartite tricarboxylate transporter substrate binding protein [Aurantimonas aggregata]